MKNIENVYSLSPLQQGLLFHQNFDPASRVYHQQVSLAIDGRLDRLAFEQAWRLLMERHAILRTAFLWEDLDDAFQVVHKDVPVPLTELDWRGRGDAGLALPALEREQREMAFAFDAAPLMRLCLVRLEQERWHMVWSFHHILLDGWSVGLALRDWLDLYAAASAGRTPVLPPVRGYHDYIGWLSEQDAGAAGSYWRRALHDVVDPTPLPQLLASRAQPDGAPCAEQMLQLTAAETATLTELGRGIQVTLNTLIQGAWALLLGGYAGREDVIFGVTSGGRPDALNGADAMVGLFINTLPLRAGWADRPQLGHWLRRLQDANSELRQFEYTPLASLRALSGLASSSSLFDSILVFENFPLDEALGEGVAGLAIGSNEPPLLPGQVRRTGGRNNYPLSLIVAPGACLELTLSYDRARFDDSEAAAMLARLRHLLRTMPGAANARVDEFNRAAPDEQARLLAWGTGETVVVPAGCLHQMFERCADAAPASTALSCASGRVTYAELEARANVLANHLIGQGVGPGEVVVIALERSAAFVVAMLATLKAGGCYLPLDLKQPAARQAALLADSGARYAVCAAGWIAPAPLRTIAADTVGGNTARPRVPALDPASAAYLIYTSGSTGTPKGVLLPHGAIVDYVAGVLHALALPPQSRFALVSTTAADLGHTQLFGALCGGGALVLVDEDTAFQPAALADFLRRERVDVLKITPGHLRGLLAAHGSTDLLPCHTLIFGGEAFDGDLLARIETMAPGLRIFNHYGPTESTVGAVLNRLDGRGLASAVPLGKPLPNRRLYVLDEERRMVGAGLPGELFIGGRALADGYLGAPALSAERFCADPFAGGAARMYRTGDRVRWLANGELAFLGRVDSQVKIRGHRVELGEVEAQVRQLSPHIAQVLARLAEVPGQGPRLLAYLVASAALDVGKLRNDLAARLPEHMIPAAFIQLDAIPLTANGKPDVRALPLPEQGAAGSLSYRAPRTAFEAALAEIWQLALKRERIGVDDNFFELGGDSILSLQIIARANQRGIRITPKQLFEYRTIARLSAHLSGESGAAAPAAPSARQVPFSAGQRARQQSGQLEPTWRCVKLERRVSAAQLEAALAALAARHSCLQLAVTQDANGQWQQSLSAPAPTVQGRQVAPDMAGDADALARLASGAGHFQAWLLDAGADLAVLLAAPALMLDETSWSTLLGDLNLVLSQMASGRQVALSEGDADFIHWAEQQNIQAQGGELDAAWEHWLALADTEITPMSHTAAALAPVTLTLPRGATAQLDGLRRRLQLEWPAFIAIAAAAELPALVGLPGGRAASDRVAGCLSYEFPCLIPSVEGEGRLDQVCRAVPELRGAEHDYGILRYLSDNRFLMDALLALPAPQAVLADGGGWNAHCEPLGVLGPVLAASRAHPGSSPLHIEASVRGACLVLECQGPLSGAGKAVLARLAELAALAGRSDLAPPASAWPLCAVAGIDASALPLEWDQVEDAYPLAPVQHGMLLHTLLAPQSGVYLVQQRYRWHGPLRQGALLAAWEQLLARHPVLRTAFCWHGDLAPVQCVRRDLAPSFAWHDLRPLDGADQQLKVQHALAEEARLGFDMARAPLTCLRVFQLADDRFELARSYHHILSDGWSFGLVMGDLLSLYRAALHGEPAALPAVRPYRDYIDWLACQDMEAARAFWSGELDGFTEPTGVAVAGAAAGPGLECEDVDMLLGVEQTRRIDRFCQRTQVTLNTCIQGAWALLLARYSGAAEVMFGVTVAGRPATLDGAADMVGLFINTLPLRVAVGDQVPLDTWLQALLQHNLKLRDFEHTPLTEIARCSDIPAGHALFDSLVVFENAPFGAQHAMAALDAEIDMLHDRSHTNYPVTLMAMPGERLGLRISHQLAALDRQSASRMMGHLCELLAQMPERAQAPLGQFRILTEHERQVMTVWNQSAREFPLERSYAELFSEAAARHPERISAVCGADSLSYAELDSRSNRLAHELIARGAGPDTLVALMAQRGLDLLTMMIAVLKAGAAFQPLDITHPPLRLAELLSLGQAPLLLVAGQGQALAEQVLAASDHAPACLDARACALRGDASLPHVHHAPGNLAYVVFTSGSTGKPKGAMVEQRGMLNNIFGKLPAIGLAAHDRLAQTASPAFDISVWQFLAAPLVGATVHILPDAVAHDPERLLHAIDEEQLTLLEVVPSMLRAMLDSSAQHPHLGSLRWLMSIGEALPPILCARWLERYPSVPLMNLYGPAECADNIAFHPITVAPAADAVHMPVGRPTANNQLFVLDPAMRPLPVGVTGEICTAGVGVGRGYLNDPQRTAAAFVDHPFAPGSRFYKTGDLGRYREDGAIEFLGRRDQQVKVQGHRVELGEIESRLLQHDAVAMAAVLALPAADGGRRLAAFWHARDGAQAEPDTLGAWLGQTLPGYMVPQSLVRLDRLPLNGNGKLDRIALAAQAQRSAEETGGAASCTASEQRLAAIWSLLLGVEDIGRQANFFALGGHSLLATQLVSRIRKEFAVELPLRAVFDHPSLAALARCVEQLAAAPEVVPITPAARGGKLELSFAQQRLWFVEQLVRGGGMLNLAFALRLSGAIDTDALGASFALLVERHEVLRTAFVSSGGIAALRIEADARFELAMLDCRAMPADGVERRIRDSLQRGFDLERAPLLRAELFQTSDDHAYLAIALHHIAADGWSLALLVDELAHAYRALRAGEQPNLAPLPLQYADYAQWQRRHLIGAPWRKHLDFWRDQLAGAPAAPATAATAVNRDAGRHRAAIAPPLSRTIRRFAERHNATPFMVMYAALNVLLYQQSGNPDLLVGTDVANRQRAETENMVGFFVNQLVLRCRVVPSDSVAQLLAHCRQTALDAYLHQDLPFETVVAELLPQRAAHQSPFFQVKLVLQNTPQRDLALDGLAVEELDLDIRETELDLLVNIMAQGDDYAIVYDYARHQYDVASIERFAALFAAALELVASGAQQAVSQVAQELARRDARLREVGLRSQLATHAASRPALGDVRRKRVSI